MRLFTAFELPEGIGEHLQMAVSSVESGVPGIPAGRGRPPLRWIPAEQRHITLAFYGEVPTGAAEDLADDLCRALDSIAPLQLRLRGAGVFSGRTLWAGVQARALASAPGSGSSDDTASSARSHSDDSTLAAPSGDGESPIIRLMRTCEHIGAGYSRNAEAVEVRHRRRAHVTLARARDRRKGEDELRVRAEALAVYEGPEWTADEVHLVLSELGAGKSGGPLYSTLARIPLNG